MILVILGVSIALFIGGIIIGEKTYNESTGLVLATLGCIVGIVALIATVTLCCMVSTDCRIDEKIAMYTEENTRIEQQIAECVERYQEYEQGVFASVSPDNAVTMVSLYPELKSNTLVESQIASYVRNNNKIKELKEQQIDAGVRKWWLYFGGEDDG